MLDTICAISSGNINQAISIIRIVGPDAIDIIKKIFSGKIGQNKTIEYGFIIDENKNKVDEVLVNFFIGNDNFVGENTIEINAHGGVVVTNKILQLILANGARLANPGEFTRRAYLNGKISLIKAEAINDLIHSKTSKQQTIAINSFNSKKEKLISDFLKEIEYLIGLCEINIDYPEYDDIPVLNNQDFINRVQKLNNEIKKIVETSEASLVYSNPLNVAIVGNPNAGKSALLNSLLKEDKSIVTNIPGTTRDVIEAEVVFNNFLLKFKDTAGIRKSNDEIEEIGINKSWNEIKNASVVFHVIDSQKGLNEIDNKIIDSVDKENQIYIQLWNKSDLAKNKEKDKIYISAKNNDLSQLENEFDKIFSINNINEELSFNVRQTSCLKKCFVALENAINSINQQYTYDVIVTDLHEGWEAIKEINGNVDKEELLDSIFKNFCLGK